MNSNNKQIRDVADVAAQIMFGQQPVTEKLHPNQQKLDVHEPEKDELTSDDFKKLRAGKKPDVAKASVQAVKNESIEEEYEDSDEEHPMMYKHVSSVNSNTWSATAKHHGKNLPKVVKDLEKERDSIKKKGGNHNATSNHDHAIMQLKQHLPSTNEEVDMNSAEMKKREKIVKGMKKGMEGFKERYGARAKNVMYATATNLAKDKA